MNITLRNYTPHHLIFEHGDEQTDLPTLGTARCQEILTPAGNWDQAGQVPRISVGYGEVTGLPDPQPGVVYVVSQLVVRALPGRSDLAYPHNLRRDSAGTVVAFGTLAVPDRKSS
jgi:hypothetical protein